MVQIVRSAHWDAKAGPLTKRYSLRKIMRSANLIITGGIAAFTTLLAIYTSPVGGRELHYWAMNLGLFSSAALVSWLFFATLLTFKNNRLKGQLLILFGYAAALACGTISGASFGAIYFIMQAEKTTFSSCFPICVDRHDWRLCNCYWASSRRMHLSLQSKQSSGRRITMR